MPETAGYFSSNPNPDLVFLQVTASKRLVRNLDGKVTTIGKGLPVVCWLFDSTGASSTQFFMWAMTKLGGMTDAPRFEVLPCDERGEPDVLVFASSDLTEIEREASVDPCKRDPDRRNGASVAHSLRRF
jgi:hypothetical protein